MKNLIAALIIIFAIVGCSSNAHQPAVENTPKAVAGAWLTAYYSGKYEEAEMLSTAATKAVIAQQAKVQDTAEEETGELIVTALRPAAMSGAAAITYKTTVFVIKQVSAGNDEATVTYATADAPEKTLPPLKLVKQNNRWLVQF